MKKYRVLIGCSNSIGLGLLEDIVAIAKLGGEIEQGITHRMTFPFHVQMIVESEEAPVPTPHVRVFDLETLQEIPVPATEAPKAATFSLEETDKTLAEQLADMKWEDLQAMAKEAGITGRDRAKVTKAYLAKFDK